MKDMHLQIPQFKMPAVWFPYDKMGKSPSGLRWDRSEGQFGPFSGQLFVADQHHATVMRVVLEQGTGTGKEPVFPSGKDFNVALFAFASVRMPLFVGMSNAGWEAEAIVLGDCSV